MTEQPTVLVVEDEESFVEALVVGLKREGFRVRVARDGLEALEVFDASRPDLVLLDVMLPRMSGVDVCRELRTKSRVPIVMVTAKASEIDTVVGLEVGADDYVTKPYRLRELVARMRAVLRRAPPEEESETSADILEVGDVRLDPERHEVVVRGEEIALPGAHEGDADRPGMGPALRRRHQDPRRPHQAPASQGRGRPLAPHADHHHPGARLPLREAPLTCPLVFRRQFTGLCL